MSDKSDKLLIALLLEAILKESAADRHEPIQVAVPPQIRKQISPNCPKCARRVGDAAARLIVDLGGWDFVITIKGKDKLLVSLTSLEGAELRATLRSVLKLEMERAAAAGEAIH